MKSSWLVALVLSLSVAAAPGIADAKRLGGGKSSGMQRDMPSRTSPQAPPAQPAAPTQAAPAVPPSNAGAAAAAPRRNWMGPLAGLAAGLGIGALLSHFGMGGALGGALGSLLMVALLAVAAFFVIRLVMGRMGGARQPAPAMSGAGGTGFGNGPQVAWPPAGSPAPVEAAAPVQALPLAAAPVQPARAFVPASFDSEGFARIAKTIFIRLQAANDTGDLDDLRRFTTPEMFAELRVELLERGGQKQQTDVLQVDTQVLDVADDGQRQIVSVRFHGLVREEAGASPEKFNEVWHLVKPNDGSREWAIAGVEQLTV